MSEIKSENKSTLKRVLQFENIATVLGFIVDTITLASIILALNSQNASSLPPIITPGLALGIWCLAAYTYIALLHSYWEKQMSVKGYSDTFGMFLLNDLMLRFRNPFALLPAVVLIITLLGIAGADKSGWIGGILLLGTIAAVVGIGVFYYEIQYKAGQDKSKRLFRLTEIDLQWAL